MMVMMMVMMMMMMIYLFIHFVTHIKDIHLHRDITITRKCCDMQEKKTETKFQLIFDPLTISG
jgi:hypothetical protein